MFSHLQIAPLADYPQWIPRLARSFFEEWRHVFPLSPYSEWEIRLRKNLQRTGLGTTYIGILESQPIAAISLKEFDIGTRKDLGPWLTGLWVTRELRRQGIGQQMMGGAEVQAAESGINRLFLWTTDKRPFYEKLGWQAHERIVHQGMLADIMRKELRSLHNSAQ